jgi:hypothetical protein
MKNTLFAAWKTYLYRAINCRRAFTSRMKEFLKEYYLRFCFHFLQRRGHCASIGRKLNSYVRKRSAGDALSHWKMICWKRAGIRSTLMQALSIIRSHRSRMQALDRREAFRVWKAVVMHRNKLDSWSLGRSAFDRWRSLQRALQFNKHRLVRSFWKAWVNRIRSLGALHSSVLKVRKGCAIVEAR